MADKKKSQGSVPDKDAPPTELQAYLKDHLGVEIPLQDIEAIKDLVKRVGADRLQGLIDELGG